VSVKSAATRALNKKHAGTAKHKATPKHKPTAHKKAATAHKQTARRTALTAKAAHARALSVGDVSCCTADALAASLRLTGWTVTAADVLALYRLTADCADQGASIVATLDAAYVFGLAGVRPVSFERAGPAEDLVTAEGGRNHPELGVGEHLAEPVAQLLLDGLSHGRNLALGSKSPSHGLILGVDLPGRHTVLASEGRWLTWGRWYDPSGWPDAVIEEGWWVRWPD
jgi:hypothetical protein